MCKALGLNALPENFQPNSETPPASDLLATISTFDQLCKQYNARVRDLTHRYLENLRLAHENIEASKKRQLVNRSLLPAYAPIARVDIEAQKEYIQMRFPLLPERPRTTGNRVSKHGNALKSHPSGIVCSDLSDLLFSLSVYICEKRSHLFAFTSADTTPILS